MGRKLAGYGVVFDEWIDVEKTELPLESIPHIAMLFLIGNGGPDDYEMGFGKNSAANHKFELWNGDHYDVAFPRYYQVLV